MSRKAFGASSSLAILLIALVIYATSPRWVYGYVHDAENGQPLAGVAITVGAQRTATDGQGYFQLGGIRGLAQVQASAPGYSPASVSLAVASLIGLRQQLSLSLQPAELRGTVTDLATRAAIAGATVRVGDRTAQTDKHGRYSIKRLLPGGQITVQAQYYEPSMPYPYTGQPEQDVALKLLPVVVTVRNEFSGEPLPGATVKAAGQTVQSDALGQAVFARLQPNTEIRGSLKGYKDGSTRASPGDQALLTLRPPIIKGTVRNQQGQPLEKARVLLQAPGQDTQIAYTNAQGEYLIQGAPEQGTLLVLKPGYKRGERKLGGGEDANFTLEPFVAKGIYIPFGLVMGGSEQYLKDDLAMVDRTELNAVVIDIKADDGWLGFKPTWGLASQIDATYDGMQDIRAILQDCKRRNIYTIARMVVFKDNVLGAARPEWAVRRNNGGVWHDNSGAIWMDAYRPEVWQYNLEIAQQAVELGFDEIQLDYLRFPSDGDIFDTNYAQECNRETRVKAIADYVAYMQKGLEKSGAFFSIDLFGLTTSINLDLHFGDLGIGQELARVAPYADYISPMVYPSTYEPGNMELRDPQRSPYLVVKIGVADGIARAGGTLIRPWLQHYSLNGIEFGVNEFRQEKQAAVESGGAGWLFWNAGGMYQEATFDP